MKMNRYAMRILSALPILCAVWLAPLPAQAEDLPSGKGFAENDTVTESRMAAGAAEDSLQACMARIPKDASIGQRMIAEQSCGRDESERKPYEVIPEAGSVRH
ncbi:MAG: exported protein of unknown function [Nitrospira sp.]|jgi:hypothetical protein|nr:exported protein of unknown function [Nitrospira sp.]